MVAVRGLVEPRHVAHRLLPTLGMVVGAVILLGFALTGARSRSMARWKPRTGPRADGDADAHGRTRPRARSWSDVAQASAAAARDVALAEKNDRYAG